MIATRKDAERIIRKTVNLSDADRIRIGYKSVQCFVTGVKPWTDVAGIAARKLSPDRHSAVQLGTLYRTGIIDWNAAF